MRLVRALPFWAVATALLVLPATSVAQEDKEGSKDHPLVSRLPGYHIRDYTQHDFDSYEFYAKDGKKVTVEGVKTEIGYWLDEGAKQASLLQIFRNYQNALTKVGAKTLYDYSEHGAYGTTTFLVTKDGNETWVDVTVGNSGGSYMVTIVEKQAMQQDVVGAETWRNDLGATGHAAVYGIYFDTDKADLKPESDAALQEIAKLLGQDAALKVMVVGHTDGTGDLARNMQLSEARARAVVAALTAKHGIAAERLSAHGVGPLSPVASNGTDEGRAKNRRVELVKQ